jgi:hypothetical protein
METVSQYRRLSKAIINLRKPELFILREGSSFTGLR